MSVTEVTSYFRNRIYDLLPQIHHPPLRRLELLVLGTDFSLWGFVYLYLFFFFKLHQMKYISLALFVTVVLKLR